jgi:proteasome accessory factor C
MEIIVTDSTVSARLGSSLARPRRLSPMEGFALAASARALLAVPGSDEDGALSRALAKLDRALGGERVVVELDAPALLAEVRAAAESGQRMQISYHSASSDRVTEREITPRRVFASEGHWYVDAMCSLARDVRRFRIDRIGQAAVVAGSGSVPDGEGVGPVAGSGQPQPQPLHRGSEFDAFVPGPDARRVRLSVDPSVAWMVETIPSSGTPVPVDDRIEIDVVVGGDAWLERLLLRLGTSVTVVDPVEDRGHAATVAARILARYNRGIKSNEK